MKLFIMLMGILWISLGIWGLVATKKMLLAVTNFVKNTKRQKLGLIQLIIGALLLISASSAKQSWFILVLGIVACLKGITTLLMSEQKLKATMDWWLAAPEIIHKWWAAAALVLGIVVFYII
ncbi:MAG: hypothetical protein HQ595_03805 [Candidatus Omnitrophica bacterium]|nr:hypothetical protein [Candidatus Omnitrophota bacterium]